MEVGPPVDAGLGPVLLGGRVLDRPDERARLGEPHLLVGEPGDAEVHHLDRVLLRDEHVLGLHVAVDRARRVDRGEALRRLAADVPAELLGHPAEVEQQVPKRLPLDVLHHEEVDVLSLVPDRVHVVRADHVLVADALPDLRLAQEALERPRGL